MISLLNYIFVVLLATGTTLEFCEREDWNHAGLDLKLPKNRAPLPLVVVAPDFPSTNNDSDLVVVHITFDIQRNGRLSNIELRDGEISMSVFTEASIRTAKKWVFLPERKDCSVVQTFGVYAQIKFSNGRSEVYLNDA